MQLKDLGNFYDAINAFKETGNLASDVSKILSQSFKKLSASQILAKVSTMGLTEAQKLELVQQFATDAANYSNVTSLTALSASEGVATGTTLGLSAAFKGLWATLMANPLVLVTAAVTAGAMAFNAYKNHVEEVRRATEESATAYKESASSIDDYVAKYQDLRQALIEAKGNEEETYNIKQQLLSLQNELNNKFGEEYGKLNLVTDAYKDQTEAIKAYNKESAKTFLNENREGINTATKRCPHLGCALQWNAPEHSWDCPCHGSRFDEKGGLMDGPAMGDLK